MTKAARAGARVSPGKILGTLAAITMVGVLGVVGTTAALSDTTDNPLNEFDAGQIELEDNDSGAFMYDVENREPGDVVEQCIQISYAGTRASEVSLFMGTPIGDLGPFLDMTVEAGTQASPVFPDCTGFATDEVLYTGDLADFQATHGSDATGLVYGPDGLGTEFEDGDTVVYKVRLELSNDPRGDGVNYSLPHTYTWQADSPSVP